MKPTQPDKGRSCATYQLTRKVGGYSITCKGAVSEPKRSGLDCADWRRKGARIAP